MWARMHFLKGASFEGFLLLFRRKSKPKQPFEEYLHKLVNSVYCDVVKDVLVLARYIGLSSTYRRTVPALFTSGRGILVQNEKVSLISSVGTRPHSGGKLMRQG